MIIRMVKSIQRFTSLDIEIACTELFNHRINIIVPNISWGMNLHECDLLVLTKSGYAYEIEIKTSKADLKADKKKKHKHISKRIKKLYFALPYYLLPDCESLIPENAGIISVKDFRAVIIRDAQDKSDYKFSEKERLNLARLGTMRILGYQKALQSGNKNNKKREYIDAQITQLKLEL